MGTRTVICIHCTGRIVRTQVLPILQQPAALSRQHSGLAYSTTAGAEGIEMHEMAEISELDIGSEGQTQVLRTGESTHTHAILSSLRANVMCTHLGF